MPERRGIGSSSRAKDAYDTVMFAQTGALCETGALRTAVIDTFTIRHTPVPAAAPPLPAEWHVVLGLLIDVFGLAGVDDVEGLERVWMSVWQPILHGSIGTTPHGSSSPGRGSRA